MRLNELISPDNISVSYRYNDRLNPKLWVGATLRGNVRQQLLTIAEDFREYLKIPESSVMDVILTGSSANYNWGPASDIDLHLVIDLDHIDANTEYVKEMLDAKRKLWNDEHDVKIHGIDVECYPQDKEVPLVAGGTFSLTKNKWIHRPIFKTPDVDEYSAKVKTASFMDAIDSAIDSGDVDKLTALKDKLWAFRQSGLDREGEFAPENIAFKTMRNNGYIEKLMHAYSRAYDKQLSLENKEVD
jgi:hypothetical protein